MEFEELYQHAILRLHLLTGKPIYSLYFGPLK